ncbi:uncharacterized protein LOC9656462 [Selaginella moellendorffii]|uniref:uncharacterized protein LOC9656462 n=1 Tax=Selaginella moellendorffii TaxID=88036 RepID=UPI000D1C8F83|nr:uncharacterized protein LOC9656462 [Selaginella moellendorffii]|eukprot:XP_024538528.1 uncharacterized protein LOC9656462 [Selaginella moellendorffii]
MAMAMELNAAKALLSCCHRRITRATYCSAKGRLALAAAQEQALVPQPKIESGLYLVATPIGNLEDITMRALRVLRSVDLILAEDTRHSSKLLQHYDIKTPKMSYHKFNEQTRQEEILERLANREALALVSDAGMPGISDPGAELVRACIEENYKIIPVPGPSAALTALIASGLPTNEFSFVGFLSTHASTRHKRLLVAAEETSTQIFFVPPNKLCSILAECATAFGSNRHCVVARELTKIYEEFWRGTLGKAQARFKESEPRGEVTLLIDGLPARAAERFPSNEELEDRLEILFESGKSLSEAVKEVSEETFVRRNSVYSLALKVLKKDKSKSEDSS